MVHKKPCVADVGFTKKTLHFVVGGRQSFTENLGLLMLAEKKY